MCNGERPLLRSAKVSCLILMKTRVHHHSAVLEAPPVELVFTYPKCVTIIIVQERKALWCKKMTKQATWKDFARLCANTFADPFLYVHMYVAWLYDFKERFICVCCSGPRHLSRVGFTLTVDYFPLLDYPLQVCLSWTSYLLCRLSFPVSFTIQYVFCLINPLVCFWFLHLCLPLCATCADKHTHPRTYILHAQHRHDTTTSGFLFLILVHIFVIFPLKIIYSFIKC